MRVGRRVSWSSAYQAPPGPDRETCMWVSIVCASIVLLGCGLVASMATYHATLEASQKSIRDLQVPGRTELSDEAARRVETRQSKDSSLWVVRVDSHVASDLRVQSDAVFGVRTNGPALRVNRVVEHCQWSEFAWRTTHTDAAAKITRKSVRYFYSLGWHRRHISSLFFDDPFSHHNPQWDPYPATEFGARAFEVSLASPRSTLNVTIDAAVLAQHAEFTHSWTPPPHSGENRTEYLASAHSTPPIVYLGKGVFYVTYRPSAAGEMFRMAARAAMGTLDFQLNDLFRSCTPGDVRVTFTETRIPPSGATIVGRIRAKKGRPSKLAHAPGAAALSTHLSADTFSRSYAGTLSAAEVRARLKAETARWLWLAGALAVALAAVTAVALSFLRCRCCAC